MVLKLNKHKAFTLAELMIILLVVSLVMAAFLPVMTRRSVNSGDIWQHIAAGSQGASDKSIFANTGAANGIVVGATNLNGDNARLILNTSDASLNHILFKQAGVTKGRLIIDANGNLGLGDVTLSGINGTAIGSGASTASTSATAFGKGAQATANLANAFGYGTIANKDWGAAIGRGASATGSGAVAVGMGANAAYNGSTSVGVSANNKVGYFNNFELGTAVGYQASINQNVINTAAGSTVVGNNALSFPANGATAATGTTTIGHAVMTLNDNAISIASSYGSIPNPIANSILIGGNNVVVPGDLIVSGDIYLLGNQKLSTMAGSNVFVSDRRLKNVGNEFTDGLDKIRKLKVYNYTLKKDKEKTPHVGVMAQDLQKIFPKAVFKDKDGYLMIRQSEMFYAMVNSVKQLDKTLESLTKDLKTLSAKYNITKIENKVVALMNNNQRDVKRIKELETENNRLESHLAKLEKLAKSR